MNVESRRDDVIDRVLADLARADVSVERADTIRRRMHARLARQTHRHAVLSGGPSDGWASALPRASFRTAAACTAALVIYIAGVIRHALQLYGR
jgi:hypothetical protein